MARSGDPGRAQPLGTLNSDRAHQSLQVSFLAIPPHVAFLLSALILSRKEEEETVGCDIHTHAHAQDSL